MGGGGATDRSEGASRFQFNTEPPFQPSSGRALGASGPQTYKNVSPHCPQPSSSSPIPNPNIPTPGPLTFNGVVVLIPTVQKEEARASSSEESRDVQVLDFVNSFEVHAAPTPLHPVDEVQRTVEDEVVELLGGV